MQSVNFRPYPSAPLKFANRKAKKEEGIPPSKEHPYSQIEPSRSSLKRTLKKAGSAIISALLDPDSIPMKTGTTGAVQSWKTQMLPAKGKRK